MNPCDWSQVNRVRLGHVRRLLRHRYGPTLPADDAGYEDLRILLHIKARCVPPERREKAMCLEAELWAPWLNGRVSQVVSEIAANPLKLTTKRLGQEFNLTTDERDRLAIWQIGAVDVTDEDRKKKRRQRDRERKRRKRLEAGAKPRAEYEAASTSAARPWIAAGISRATWYRQRARETDVSANQKRDTASVA